jgi:hypothetical protein
MRDQREVAAEDLAGMEPEDLLRLAVVERRVRAVGVTAALLAVEIRDHHRRVILHEPEFGEPVLQRALGCLAVGDVDVGADDPAARGA